MPWIKVAKVEEIPAGSRKVVDIDPDLSIAVFHVDGEWYAVENRCTHDDGPLVEGDLVAPYVVECPRHGARFDIRTGDVLRMPAFEPVPVFEVKVESGEVYVQVE